MRTPTNAALSDWVSQGRRNAFSKKPKNRKAALAFCFAHYNFRRRHITPGTTLAIAAGLAGKVWSVRELLEAAAQEY